MKMRTRILSMALIILVSLACAAIGAENPEVSLSAQGVTIDKVMADLSQQAGVQIVCDSGVKAAVSGQFSSMKLEQLLDTITKANNLKWQKIYMPAKADSKPTLEEIKARAAALNAVTGAPLVIFDPTTGKQKVFVEQDPAAPSVTPDKLGLKPVYLITAPKAAAEPAKADSEAQKRFQSLTDERMRLLQGMSSEDRQTALQQEMWYTMNMDQSARQQMFMDQFNARRNMSPQLREQYQQSMRDTFRSMREQGLIPNGGWHGGDGGGHRGGGNNNQQQR